MNASDHATVAIEESPATTERMLLFELGRGRYALPLTAVAGLARPKTLRSIPGAPPSVLGLTEWRGRLFSVLDLPRLLEETPCGRGSCLVRLSPPLEQTALYLPGTIRLAPRVCAPVPEPGSDEVVGATFRIDGEDYRMIDVGALVLRVEREIRGRR